MRVEIIRQLSKLPKLDIPPTEGLAAWFARSEPYVLAAFDGDRLAGWLPFKQVTEQPLGLTGLKLARASEHHGYVDDSCAKPMLDFLIRNEQFSLLELCEPQGGPLSRALPSLASLRFGVQTSPGGLRACVPLGRDLDAWFHTLDGWAAPLARRTRSLMASGEVELVTCDDPQAGKELLSMYMELEARSYKLDAATGVGGDARQAALHAALAEAGATLFHFLLLDGLPIAASLSLRVKNRIIQLENVCDMSFEDTAPEEVMFMLEVREAINRGCKGLELCSDLVPRHSRLGATPVETEVLHVYRRFGAHHFDGLRRQLAGEESAVPMHAGPMRSDLGKQLRARTHATEILDRLDSAGVGVERLWGDQLRACLPFEVHSAEHERVRRAV